VLSFSRADEAEADRLGLELMRRAGYDGEAMAQFFEKLDQLRKSEPTLFERFTSSHPLSADRVTAVRKELRRPGQTQTAVPQPPTSFSTVQALFARD